MFDKGGKRIKEKNISFSAGIVKMENFLVTRFICNKTGQALQMPRAADLSTVCTFLFQDNKTK